MKMTDDTISRQAAIDVIDEYDFEFPNYMERFVTELRDAMKADLKNDIEALPSAQPQITHCAECIHWKHSSARKSYCEVFDWMNTAEDFCSFAERITE